MWWAVLRRAAVDVLRGSETQAWDAAEFLYSTGVWLCDDVFGVPTTSTQAELIRLMTRSRALRDRVREVTAEQRRLNGR